MAFRRYGASNKGGVGKISSFLSLAPSVPVSEIFNGECDAMVHVTLNDL